MSFFFFSKAEISVASGQECDKNSKKLSANKKKNLFRSAGLESNWPPLSCVYVAAFLLDGTKTSGASKSNRQKKKRLQSTVNQQEDIRSELHLCLFLKCQM